LVALYILWQIRQLLLLLFTAVAITIAVNALVKRFQKLGLKRVYAVLLSVGVLVVATGFGLLIVPPFAEQLQQLIELVPQGIEQLSMALARLENRLPTEIIEALPSLSELTQQLQPVSQRLLGSGWIVFSGSFSVLLNVLLVVVLTLMLLADPQPYRRGFVRLFPSFYRRRVDEILVL